MAGDADHRGDVDDAALARLHHAAHHRLAAAEDAGEVGVEDRLPVLVLHPHQQVVAGDAGVVDEDRDRADVLADGIDQRLDRTGFVDVEPASMAAGRSQALADRGRARVRSEEHTSELQSLMRISYAVFCLKKKKPRVNRYQSTP